MTKAIYRRATGEGGNFAVLYAVSVVSCQLYPFYCLPYIFKLSRKSYTNNSDMSSIAVIIEEVAAAAKLDDQRDDPEAHAALLRGIQRLQLAVEKPTETAKRIIYQVRVSLIAA